MNDIVLCELAPTPIPNVQSYSPFCLKAHRALRAAKLPYTSRHAGDPAAHKAPTGQVPVLEVGGARIHDSTRILQQVMALAPGAIAEAPEAWLYEELADTALNGFLVAARWADDDNWPRVREAYFGDVPQPIRAVLSAVLRKKTLKTLVARDVWRDGAAACWARFERLLDQLEARAPAQGFWCGERLSVADVALFAQLHSFRTALTPAQKASVERRKTLTAWLDRVDAATA